MTTSTLLAELRNRGIEPLIRDGRLKLRGPAAAITPDLVAEVRAAKPALLAHFRERERKIEHLKRADGWRPLPPPGAPAYSILETCRLRNISLRLDDKGALIIGRSDLLGAEPPLWLIAIEALLEAVTALVAAGWCLNAKPLIEKAGGLSFDFRQA